jgi:hypothetical protein
MTIFCQSALARFCFLYSVWPFLLTVLMNKWGKIGEEGCLAGRLFREMRHSVGRITILVFDADTTIPIFKEMRT